MRKMKILFILFLLLTCSKVNASWNLISGNFGIPGNERSLISDGGNFYISLSLGDPRIYKSINSGFDWISISGNLPNYSAGAIFRYNNVLYTTLNGVEFQSFFKSTNEGTNWNSIVPCPLERYSPSIKKDNNNNLWLRRPYYQFGFIIYNPTSNTWDSSLVGNNFSCFDINGATIVAHVSYPFNKIYYSSNNGLNWTTYDCTLDFSNDISVNSSTVLLANFRGIFKSTNKGQDWQQVFDKNSFCLEQINNNVFVGTIDGVWGSSNIGSTWQNLSNNQLDSIDIFELSYNTQYLLGIGKKI